MILQHLKIYRWSVSESNFKFADLTTHRDFLITASKDAQMILELDPKLVSERGKALRELLYLFKQDDAIKTYLAG